VIHILTILVFASLVLRDSLRPPLVDWFTTAEIAAITLVPLAVLSAFAEAGTRLLMHRLDARSDTRVILWIDWLLASVRWSAVLWHAVCVLGLGWLDAVRTLVPAGFVADQFLAALPALAVIVLSWWSAYPLERRLREAALVRWLDEGRPIHALPARGTFVWMQVRHQLLLVMVPMLALSAWSQGLTRLIAVAPDLLREQSSLAPAGDWLAAAEHAEIARVAGQLLGAACLFTLMPLVLRRLWDTEPLSPGPARDALDALCARHGVRVSAALVWRTRGVLINAMVMGLLPRLRYVLLTDALLENLPDRQVEAVLAHEVGHVRRRHMPWLAASLIACVGLSAAGADAIARWIWSADPVPWIGGVAQLALAALGLAAGLAAFGWISRRFEWQADAFAAAHLSGASTARRTAPASASAPVAADGAHAMIDALLAVARLNHIPLDEFSWRHGSMRRRIANLHALVGQPADRLRPDRTAGAVKTAIALGCAAIAVLVFLEP